MISPLFKITGEEAKGLLFGLLEVDKQQLRKNPQWPSMRELIKQGKVKYNEYDPLEHWKTTRELMAEVEKNGVAEGDCEDLATAVCADDQVRYGIESLPFAYSPKEGLYHVVSAVPKGKGTRFGGFWPEAMLAPSVSGYDLIDPSAAAGMPTRHIKTTERAAGLMASTAVHYGGISGDSMSGDFNDETDSEALGVLFPKLGHELEQIWDSIFDKKKLTPAPSHVSDSSRTSHHGSAPTSTLPFGSMGEGSIEDEVAYGLFEKLEESIEEARARHLREAEARNAAALAETKAREARIAAARSSSQSSSAGHATVTHTGIPKVERATGRWNEQRGSHGGERIYGPEGHLREVIGPRGRIEKLNRKGQITQHFGSDFEILAGLQLDAEATSFGAFEPFLEAKEEEIPHIAKRTCELLNSGHEVEAHMHAGRLAAIVSKVKERNPSYVEHARARGLIHWERSGEPWAVFSARHPRLCRGRAEEIEYIEEGGPRRQVEYAVEGGAPRPRVVIQNRYAPRQNRVVYERGGHPMGRPVGHGPARAPIRAPVRGPAHASAQSHPGLFRPGSAAPVHPGVSTARPPMSPVRTSTATPKASTTTTSPHSYFPGGSGSNSGVQHLNDPDQTAANSTRSTPMMGPGVTMGPGSIGAPSASAKPAPVIQGLSDEEFGAIAADAIDEMGYGNPLGDE